MLLANPCLTPANLTLEDNEPPAGLRALSCLHLLPLTVKSLMPMLCPFPDISSLVITMFSAGVSSANLIVVMSLPSPYSTVLFGYLFLVTLLVSAFICTLCYDEQTSVIPLSIYLYC